MPEFGIVQALVLIVLLVLMFAATVRISKLWREDVAKRIFKTMRSWWFWGDALLRGWIRALPLGLAGGWLLAGSMILAALLATETIPEGGFLALAVLVVAIFVCLALVGSVMLVNRPLFAVPPYLRKQPGAIEEWRAGRRKRKSTI